LKALSQPIIEVTSGFELLDALKVFFFLHNTLVVLLLNHAVLLLRTLKLLGASLHVALDVLLNILQVMK
jgi:hypothetical protein